jgi:hypothetical protein
MIVIVFLVLAALATIATIALGVVALRRSALAQRGTIQRMAALAGISLLAAPASVAFGVFPNDFDEPSRAVDSLALSALIGWAVVLPILLTAVGVLWILSARRMTASSRRSRGSRIGGWLLFALGAAAAGATLYAVTHLGNHLCC